MEHAVSTGSAFRDRVIGEEMAGAAGVARARANAAQDVRAIASEGAVVAGSAEATGLVGAPAETEGALPSAGVDLHRDVDDVWRVFNDRVYASVDHVFSNLPGDHRIKDQCAGRKERKTAKRRRRSIAPCLRFSHFFAAVERPEGALVQQHHAIGRQKITRIIDRL